MTEVTFKLIGFSELEKPLDNCGCFQAACRTTRTDRVGHHGVRADRSRQAASLRLRTGAAVSRACFQSHEICTVNFMAISAVASGSSLLTPTLTSASMPRVPRKVTAVPDETPKLTF